MADRLVLAVHEAAHAVIAAALGYPILACRLDPPEVEIGTVFDRHSRRDELVVVLAGNMALVRARLRGASAADEADARDLTGKLGLSAWEITLEQARAEVLVDQHWPAIAAVALALGRSGSLSGADVRRLMAKPPDEEQAVLVDLALGLRAS